MVTQTQLARTLGIDVSTVNKILNRTPGYRFRNDTILRVFRMAKSLGFDVDLLKFRHQRRHARTETQTESDLVLYTESGRVLARGTAVIRNFSNSGALLTDIRLATPRLPTQSFFVEVTPHAGRSWKTFRGRVLRLRSKARIAWGIEFEPRLKTLAQ